MDIEPGVYDDVPFETYVSWNAVNKSNLWEYLYKGCAAKYKYMMTYPKETTTEALMIGHASHTALLEPDKFDKLYIISPELAPDGRWWDRRGTEHKKAWKEFQESVGGRILLTEEQAMLALSLARTLDHSPYVQGALADGRKEVSIVWNDHRTGIRCKGRIDIWAGNAILDYKTTRSAAIDRFGYDAYKYGYHYQAAFYFDGLRQVIGKEIERFIIIAQEKEPPYLVAFYEIHPDAMGIGRDQYKSNLDEIRECQDAGVWPGYVGKPVDIVLPRFAGEEMRL